MPAYGLIVREKSCASDDENLDPIIAEERPAEPMAERDSEPFDLRVKLDEPVERLIPGPKNAKEEALEISSDERQREGDATNARIAAPESMVHESKDDGPAVGRGDGIDGSEVGDQPKARPAGASQISQEANDAPDREAGDAGVAERNDEAASDDKLPLGVVAAVGAEDAQAGADRKEDLADGISPHPAGVDTRAGLPATKDVPLNSLAGADGAVEGQAAEAQDGKEEEGARPAGTVNQPIQDGPKHPDQHAKAEDLPNHGKQDGL